VMEPLSAVPDGASASRSRANKDRSLPALLSGAGMDRLRLSHQRLNRTNLAIVTAGNLPQTVCVLP
jgi:hypothetical protein